MAVAKLAWKVLALIFGLVAAKVTRSVLERGWKKTVGGDPPRNPAAPGTRWKEAFAWAAASGMALAISKLVATHGAAKAWQKTTGSLPPGVEEAGA
jgi:hypothetical protein